MSVNGLFKYNNFNAVKSTRGSIRMKKYILVSAILAAAVCAVCAQTPAAAPEAMKAAPAIKVEKIAAAAGVENREPVGEAVTFDRSAGKVFIWTRIASEVTPVTIKHVYYLNGKMVREIELKVNSSPYRVWSWKNVTPGSWKVEVTDESGAVLAAAEFTVTEAKAAEEPVKTEEPRKVN
jgi:hypothetical protein